MLKKVKAALCGHRGKKFGITLNSLEHCEVTAVWDPSPEKANGTAAALGCRCEPNYDSLLSDPEITSVIITVPNRMHTEFLLKSIAAGKHIFLEKPLCIDVEEAYAIRSALKESHVKFYMSDPFVNASTIYTRSFIRSGALGKLLSVRIRYCSDDHVYSARSAESIQAEAAQMGGGMMSGTGGHPLHIINYLLGKPERIHAAFSYGNPHSERGGWEEYIAMMMEYPDEVIALVEAGKISPGFVNGIEACGTKGVITVSGIGGPSGTIRYKLCGQAGVKAGQAKQSVNDWVTVDAGDLPPEPDPHIPYWVKMQLQDLPNELVGVDNASTHGINIDSAVELVEMREAIYASARTHQTFQVR